MRTLFTPRHVDRLLWLCLLLVGVSSFVGCAYSPTTRKSTSSPVKATENRLRVGDQIVVRVETNANQPVQTLEISVDENGEISLPLVGRIKASGLSPSELQERIQANYVPRYYVRCTALVLVSARFFYLGGEVRAPGRYPWTDDITLMKAIMTGGGFSDYANRKKVEITRNKETRRINCEDLRAHPDKDVSVQPGDSINIPRSIF